jgi:DNA-binding NtrC family response regulator
MGSPGPDDAQTKTLLDRDDDPWLRTHKIRVEVAGGPDVGRVLERPGPEVRIGSSRGCDIVLTDPTVSRHHVTLRIDRGRVRVLDAGSRNGTRLDGLTVRDADARPDSQIVIGNTTLRLRLLEATVSLPLSKRERFGGLLGTSVAMRRIFSILERVAPTDTPVLIEGETGTGKELAAEAIHEHSTRSSGPYVVFDCSAVSPSLIESELFGHVRGAFTGATAERIGAFEAASGGTLFLDEIGELPLDLQPKLLRALEKLEVRRVGETARRAVDVRIVSATNLSLSAEVDRGTFREDLYYRLDVLRVELPPLRERPDDVPLLAQHFAAQIAADGATSLPAAMLKDLASQAWPGNARELRNAVARALSLGVSSVQQHSGGREEHASATPVDLAVPLKHARDQLCESFEIAYLKKALDAAGGNVTRAAEIAGVHRRFIHRAIARYRLRETE